jgi:hypothetical protein
MTTPTTTKTLLPLIKKTPAEKLKRFEETIKKHQRLHKKLAKEPMGPAEYEVELIDRIIAQCNQDKLFKNLREYYSQGKFPQLSTEHLLVRMLCQRYKDPLLLLERNHRPFMYDQEAWSEDAEQEEEARRLVNDEAEKPVDDDDTAVDAVILS